MASSAAPVINTTESIQSWRQWESFEFQPFATNNPAIWQASGLPTGVTMAAAPPLLSATATLASPTVVTVSLTGTVATTSGSAAVTGTGTLFTSELKAGAILTLGGNSYTVLSIASDTALTLSTNAAATTSGAASGHPYSVGDKVFFSDLTGGTGLVVNQTFFVRTILAAGTMNLASVLGGTAVNVTGSAVTAAKISKVHTGKISGAASVAGISTASLVAVNDLGPSAVLPLYFGIEPTVRSLDSGNHLTVDLATGLVTSDGAGAGDAALFSAKLNDDKLLYVQFTRGGIVVDLGATTGGTGLNTLKFGLKELDTDNVIVTGGGADSGVDTTPMSRFGTGTGTTYVLAVTFNGDALNAALSNYDADDITRFFAHAELEWVIANPSVAAGTAHVVGPATLRNTSRTFSVEVVRDLVTN